jgi:NAD(P)H-flavin reductase
MATQKQGTVRGIQRISEDVVVVDIGLDAPLEYRGGQYVIIDSGRTLPNGKAGKRAYSMLNADADQQRLQFATLRIPGGVVSDYVHGLGLGDTVTFSGPWGKLGAKLDPNVVEPTLVVATDTGITAILGLLSSVNYRSALVHTTLLWLRNGENYFLPEQWVRERLPSSLSSVVCREIPAFEDPVRLDTVRGLIQEHFLAHNAHGRAFWAGDGSVHYGLMEELNALGLVYGRDDVESFFNMPERKST